MRLVVWGLELLGASLVAALLIPSTQSPTGLSLLSWTSSAALYTGVALVVTGLVVRELRRREEPGAEDRSIDHYGP